METEISVIVPAKNEQDSIATLYKEISSVFKSEKLSFEIIFVDDGSTDNTFNEIERLRKSDKRVKAIRHRGNLGKSVALQNGFDRAKGRIVLTLDADLQDNPKEIPNFIKKIDEGYDVVSGWKKKRNDPISKVVPSRVINFLVRVMTGLRLHDINCGFKAYRKEALGNLNLYGDLYRFIPIFLYRQNYRVGEIAIDHRARKFGKSKYGWKRFISGWLDLLTVFFLVRYLRRPGHFFGTIGAISFTSGFAIGLYISYLRFSTGTVQNRHPLLFLGMLLMIIGVQLISTGLLAEMILFQKPRDSYASAIKETLGL